MNSPDYSVSFPGLGIQNLEIAREAFSIGPITVYWYGLLIAFAVLLAMFLALRHCRRFGISQDDVLDMYLVAILTGLVGARVYYVIFEWPRFADDWRRIFSMREGLAFYGGVIGGILAVWVLGRIKKRPSTSWPTSSSPTSPSARPSGAGATSSIRRPSVPTRACPGGCTPTGREIT